MRDDKGGSWWHVSLDTIVNVAVLAVSCFALAYAIKTYYDSHDSGEKTLTALSNVNHALGGEAKTLTDARTDLEKTLQEAKTQQKTLGKVSQSLQGVLDKAQAQEKDLQQVNGGLVAADRALRDMRNSAVEQVKSSRSASAALKQVASSAKDERDTLKNQYALSSKQYREQAARDEAHPTIKVTLGSLPYNFYDTNSVAQFPLGPKGIGQLAVVLRNVGDAPLRNVTLLVTAIPASVLLNPHGYSFKAPSFARNVIQDEFQSILPYGRTVPHAPDSQSVVDVTPGDNQAFTLFVSVAGDGGRFAKSLPLTVVHVGYDTQSL